MSEAGSTPLRSVPVPPRIRSGSGVLLILALATGVASGAAGARERRVSGFIPRWVRGQTWEVEFQKAPAPGGAPAHHRRSFKVARVVDQSEIQEVLIMVEPGPGGERGAALLFEGHRGVQDVIEDMYLVRIQLDPSSGAAKVDRSFNPVGSQPGPVLLGDAGLPYDFPRFDRREGAVLRRDPYKPAIDPARPGGNAAQRMRGLDPHGPAGITCVEFELTAPGGGVASQTWCSGLPWFRTARGQGWEASLVEGSSRIPPGSPVAAADETPRTSTPVRPGGEPTGDPVTTPRLFPSGSPSGRPGN